MSSRPNLASGSWHLAFHAALGVALAAAARAAQPTEPPADFPDVVARVRKAVGAVGTYNPAARPPMEFHATGFFIDPRGFFITADHALTPVAQAKRLTDLRVFLPADADRRGRAATIIARESRFDLAVLKVEGAGFDVLKLADSTKAREGQGIALCGYPFGFLFGLNPSTSAGIISNIGPIALPAVNASRLDPQTLDGLRHPFDVLQLDANAYPGHSGGPVFDMRTGEVLGVVNSGHIQKTREKAISSGFTYAIPIHLVKRVVDEIIAGKAPEPKAPQPEHKAEEKK